MLITEMTECDCFATLARQWLGRLSCAHENQPYIVPMYFAFEGSYLYGFTTPGQKFQWMRSNPLVCVEVDEITASDDWMSIVVFGRFEELRERRGMPEWDPEQRRPHPPGQRPTIPAVPKSDYERAHDLLQERHPEWFEPSVASSLHRNPKEPMTPVYYRIHIDRITGRRASPGVVTPIVAKPPAPAPGS